MAMAIETVTLPCRLRELGGRQASLSHLVDILNTDGRQNFFELAASLPQVVQENGSTGGGVSGFSNRHAETSLAHPLQTNRERTLSQGTAEFDMHYAIKLSPESQETDPHIFSQAVTHRGLIATNEAAKSTDHIMSGIPSTDTVMEK
jgi:hypothetical protein